MEPVRLLLLVVRVLVLFLLPPVALPRRTLVPVLVMLLLWAAPSLASIVL